ncbi:MAG: uridine diphosphate-N-acetylglucosamine-binding protein YvcK [Erysipelotrichaceae bacterium]|nr:uridine diphosphate-N-acetylglucosamine-binding protein YvcK [Erysipelotrichaceae bacterium]
MKKVVVLGGGTGQSTLLKGLKLFPIDISAVVSVCDDGQSTGRLREEFNTFAVGDIRKVITSLSETEPLFEELLNYRFKTTSDLNGHTVGNLLLTALSNITGNMQEGIETIGKVLKIKGKVLPFTLESPILIGKMTDGTIIRGEHNITQSEQKIQKVYYEKNVKVNPNVLKAIQEADLIILSMGSLYTSVIPNLLSKELLETIDKSKAKIMYVCNMMTQPGETDDFKASDHVKVLNSYLGKKKIEIMIANNGEISPKILEKYFVEEQKDPVQFDPQNLKQIRIISSDYVTVYNNVIRYKPNKLAADIYNYLLEQEDNYVLY